MKLVSLFKSLLITTIFITCTTGFGSYAGEVKANNEAQGTYNFKPSVKFPPISSLTNTELQNILSIRLFYISGKIFVSNYAHLKNFLKKNSILKPKKINFKRKVSIDNLSSGAHEIDKVERHSYRFINEHENYLIDDSEATTQPCNINMVDSKEVEKPKQQSALDVLFQQSKKYHEIRSKK